MTVGAVVGAVVGGAIGFFVGGPVGAMYGAGIGFGIGMAVDPMTPDVPSSGAPDSGDLVMSSVIGDPVADLAGTGKITGHLLCYGNERVEKIYTKTSGGKGGGGSQKQVSGYNYYMSWVLGIVAGPVDVLYAVYKGDDIVWSGKLECPESGGQETIVLEDTGSMVFYFGTADQVANSKVGSLISDSTLNTPYRNLCWAFLDDCLIGNYNRAPTLKFMIKKISENSFSTEHEIQKYDCNPAHVLWYTLHNLTGLPESWLDAVSFAAVASTLKTEGRGISVLFNKQQSALNWLEQINLHIDGILRFDLDGKFHLKLIREDYNVEGLPLVDESVLLEEPTLTRKSWIDTVNEIKVQYNELINVERVYSYGPLSSCGSNSDGQLGLGDTTERTVFVQGGQNDWEVISGGYYHSLGIESNATLWSWGGNFYGQLGLGDNGGGTNRLVPTQIGIDSWKKVSAGGSFSFALKSDDTLWSCGINNFGQLGLGDITSRNVFSKIGSYFWGEVAVGANHCLALKSFGELWSWGYNSYGQLGLGDNGGGTNRLVPTQIGMDFWGEVAVGASHSLALKSDGTLWSWGYNSQGQLGLGGGGNKNVPTRVGTDTDFWKEIAAGAGHSLALKSDGTLWSWGYNSRGQLGLGDDEKRFLPVQVGMEDTWEKVSAGQNHSLALKSDGTLWSWGYNSQGQLGLGGGGNKNVPTQVGTDIWLKISAGFRYSLALKLK